ncbi:MAG TPA: SDR family NAD(P)-dependent oxidoreductase [Solirubrobacteraceae bacterium]
MRHSTVLLTGAYGGLGQAIAHALAARGAKLLLSGRRAELLEPLAEAVGGRSVVCDLAARGDVARLGELAAEAGVGILIANAAVPASGALQELTQRQIDDMLEVNLRAPVALARSLVPGMVARGSGQLVFISSLQGKAATPGAPLYLASKFGLRGLALGLREDLREHGVGVSTVFPGFIRDAGMFAKSGVTLPPGVGTRSPQDVAAAVLRAIDEDRAELDVAPLALRLGATAAGVAPALAASVSRRLGSHRIASSIADTQRDQR